LQKNENTHKCVGLSTGGPCVIQTTANKLLCPYHQPASLKHHCIFECQILGMML